MCEAPAEPHVTDAKERHERPVEQVAGRFFRTLERRLAGGMEPMHQWRGVCTNEKQIKLPFLISTIVIL